MRHHGPSNALFSRRYVVPPLQRQSYSACRASHSSRSLCASFVSRKSTEALLVLLSVEMQQVVRVESARRDNAHVQRAARGQGTSRSCVAFRPKFTKRHEQASFASHVYAMLALSTVGGLSVEVSGLLNFALGRKNCVVWMHRLVWLLAQLACP